MLPSIRTKITRGVCAIAAVNLLLVALCLLAVPTMLTDRLAGRYLEGIHAYVERDAAFLLLVQDPVSLADYVENVRRLPWIETVAIHTDDGGGDERTGTYRSGTSAWQPPERALASGTLRRGDALTHLAAPLEVVEDGVRTVGGYLHLGVDRAPLERTVRHVVYGLAAVLLVGTALLALLALRLANGASAAVSRLSDALAPIGTTRDAAAPLALAPDTREIAEVERGVNALLARLAHHHEELERTVAERTGALGEALERQRVAEATRSSLIMNLSHDLRTPLTATHGYLDHAREALDEHPPDASAARRALDRAKRHSASLAREIDTLLQYSTSGAVELSIRHRDIAIAALVADAVAAQKLASAAAGNRVSHRHRGAAEGHLAPRLLRHILDNLLANANRHTREGHIRIATAVSGERDLLIGVRDDGPGIPPELRERIFEPHFQGETDAPSPPGPAGVGIGLTLTKFWVERLGGTITVTSTPGAGTRFRLSLPCPPVRGHAERGDYRAKRDIVSA